MYITQRKNEVASFFIGNGKCRVLLKPLLSNKRCPGAATHYEDMLHANEIIKSLVGTAHTHGRACVRRQRTSSDDLH